MKTKFVEGLLLKAVVGPSGADGDYLHIQLGDKPHQCKEIVVVDQSGPFGPVPWAQATMNNGFVFLANLSLMESVDLLEVEVTA